MACIYAVFYHQDSNSTKMMLQHIEGVRHCEQQQVATLEGKRLVFFVFLQDGSQPLRILDAIHHLPGIISARIGGSFCFRRAAREDDQDIFVYMGWDGRPWNRPIGLYGGLPTDDNIDSDLPDSQERIAQLAMSHFADRIHEKVIQLAPGAKWYMTVTARAGRSGAVERVVNVYISVPVPNNLPDTFDIMSISNTGNDG